MIGNESQTVWNLYDSTGVRDFQKETFAIQGLRKFN